MREVIDNINSVTTTDVYSFESLWRFFSSPSTFEWDENTPFSSIRWPIGGVLLYIIVVVSLRIGMRSFQPLSMAYATFVHNAILFVWSICMFVGCSLSAFPRLRVRVNRVSSV
jgi:hypothetical protein